MTPPDELFPNLWKIARAKQICLFLDWVAANLGARLMDGNGAAINVAEAVGYYSAIDRAAVTKEAAQLEEIMRGEKGVDGGRVN